MNLINNLIGGEVIGYGGFGCVFRPAIKCSSNKKIMKNSISKILIRRKGKEEFEQAKVLENILYKIRNYRKYFILPTSICIPKKFRKQDLYKFERKCKAFKNKITKKNINKKKNFLVNVISQDGGYIIDEYIKHIRNINKFDEYNFKIMDLIKNAVIPMNNKNVYHFDLKSSNILFKKNQNFQIIDWGISYVNYNDDYQDIMNRPLQFNVPYTILLFYDSYQDAINTTANSNFGFISKDDALECAEFIITDYATKYSSGHLPFLRLISKQMLPDFSEIYLIKNFIALAIMEKDNYKQVDGKLIFNRKKYYQDIFKHNMDIFGVLSSYFNFYDTDFKKKIPRNLYQEIVNNLNIYFKPLIFDCSNKKMSTSQLLNQIKKINLGKYKTSYLSKKSSSLKKSASKSRSKSKSKSKRKYKSKYKNKSRKKSINN